MKTSNKIMNVLFFTSLLFNPIHAEGFNISDTLTSLTPALTKIGASAEKQKAAEAAQDNAQSDSKKEDFKNMVSDKQAATANQQREAASVVKGFPMLDPHSAYLSEGYKAQRNAMFQRSINKAAGDYKRINETTQAALDAEDAMTMEAAGAISGVVGKLTDQMNKSDETAAKIERDEVVAACAQNPNQCKPDEKGYITVKIDGKNRKYKLDDALLKEIEAQEDASLGAEIDKAKMEAVLGAKGEGSWGYDPSTVLANPLLEDPNLKLTIRTYCKAEMTESRARKCATAVSQANGKINAKQEELDAEGKSVNANAVALREDMIRLTKSMNLIKNVVGGTATLVEDGTKCNSNYKDSVTLNARYQPLFTKVTELDSKFDNIVAQSKLEFQTSYTNGVAKVLSQCKDPDKKDQIAELLSSAEKELANVRKNDPTNETMIRELLEKVEALKLISN